MNTNTAKRFMVAGITAMAVIWSAGAAHALKAPHDYTKGVTCSSVGLNKGCHSKTTFWKGMTSINTSCLNTTVGCHRPDGLAKKKALSVKDASDRFGSIDLFRTSTSAKNSSHAWKVPAVNSNAGAAAVNMLSEKQWYNSVNKTKFFCTRCHRAMGDALAKGDKFLREPATGNYICYQCHSARRISNVRDYNSSVASGALHYSHPVEVNYSTARAAKPDFFLTTFRLTTGYDESARPRLYTTHESAQGGTKKGAVVCQSCHGPIHAADSNPYTFDNLSAYSTGNYSSSAGNLLRTYPIAGPKASNNLCLSCHKVTTHQSFMCGRCHTPHKKAGENNRYLILENISTPSSGKRSVVFTSRSEMAARFAAGYSSTAARTLRQVSNRICQVCHMARKFHNNYSSPGGTVKRTHNMNNEGDPSQKYKFCPNCHKHNNPAGGFKPSGCATCHKFPPDDVINSTQSFKHAKHTNANVEGSEDTFWKTGKVTDSRSDTSYGFSCGRCHSRWAPYTATAGDGYEGKNHYGTVSPSSNYTTDIGFKVKTSINSLPWNLLGSYVYNGTSRAQDPGETGGTTKWWGAGTGATCSQLYCHGQWYNGYTSNNPTATGTQACGKCHGASNIDPPGKTGGNNYGAHPRHVGSANNQQYGSGTPNFRCNACHSLTSKYNNETTVTSRKYHVNGIVNIKFDNGSSSNFRVGNAISNYGGSGGYNNYTSRRPASFIRPAYTTCRLIYCHSNGSRTLGNYSAPNNAGINPSSPWPNWSSSRNFTTTMSIGGYNMKTRCARCHGNAIYKGITAAMPNYTSNDPSYTIKGPKENSHRKHVVENKFRCNICHSSTISSANNAIVSTQNHVNKFYNISIISAYRDGGVGNNYDSAAKRCSSITCHAGKTTPAWGSKIGCPNCHMSNTGDNDKRIKVSNTFQSFSESAPRIYSTQWAETGHGRSSATQYGGGNYGANKVCTNCHMASVPHGTSNNPFRLYTAPGRPNRVCEGCHGTSPWVGGGALKQGIQTHASSVVQTGKHNFAIKCIDCHDPHGDNNSRFMVHSTVARPLITGTRAESSNQYGQRQTNVTSSNVDFVANQYTSDYAKKIKSPKICQVCHTRTKDQTASDPKPGRFRWYSAGDKAHGSGKCTSCHSHGSGFKGAGCNGCHGFPPTDAFNVLSGSGRTLANLDNRQRPSGNSGSEDATAGAHRKHFGNFSNAYNSSKTTICSFCHQGGMYATGSLSLDIEIGFKAFTDYSGTSQKYGGQSAVRNGYYGYSGIGINSNNDMRCAVKCHGGDSWLSNSLGNYSAPRWNVSNSVRCGKCHGAKKASGQGSWPTSNRHAKHAGTGVGEYDFMCRVCHADTVMGTATTLNRTNHVNGQATFKFYTGTFTGSRVWSQSKYTSGDTKVNSGFGWCKNLYCHSRGTTTSPPYDAPGAYSNYTAKWTTDFTLPPWTSDPNSKCSFCHGSKKSAGGYAGITSAMPNQADQAHKKHVVDNGFKCNVCHSATVNSNNGIISVANHVNKFKNISIISAYRTGQTMYSSSLSSTNKTCKNVRCHAGRKTPNWTVTYGTINCPDCHYSNTSDTDNFAWTNFSGTNSVAARIYSTEWANSGHGRPASSKYTFSNNSGAGRNCTNCHKPAAKHNAAGNYFRLLTSNPDRLCISCHGKTSEGLGSFGVTVSNITGIQTHSWYNISTAGYVSASNGGNKKKATLYGGWSFGEHDGDQKKVKCVDCHDPHGDRNNYMVHRYINMSGSDRVGRPNPLGATAQTTFSTAGGLQINWSSYVKPVGGELGICQRCHSVMSNTTAMDNFNKNRYSNHNRGNRCTKCHKHRQGFKPSGCDGCHGYPPPNGPTSPNNWLEQEASPSTVGLHTPHAKNPRGRLGITAENDVPGSPGFKCNKCHANTADGADPTMGSASNTNAIMQQLTSVYGDWSPGAQAGKDSVTDDTCSKITCHTPRYYTRTWKKPSDCDDCHGYTKGKGAANRVFNLQTTGSHKIHINWTGTTNLPASWKKNYKLACSNCHYDWPATQNYSTHYNSFVNITANGPVNTIANMKVNDGQFYTPRGRSFKGFTTGNESFGTCAKAYCHGNFANGTTATMPNWKKGVSTVTCISCHKGRLTFGNGSTMPERHQKHVKTNQYGFACVRCHVRTTNNITTIIFNDYSSHVNGRKDVYFNNQGGIDNTVGSFNPIVSSRQCSNTYCHSKGYRSTGSSFTTRTTLANYTADWDVTASGRTNGKPCSFCHGNKIYNGITAAMPNQTSVWGNSHRTHVIRNNFRCVNCHAATVNSAGTINYAGGKHVDGFKTITIIAAYKSGATSYGAGKTCANVKCHAGKTTPQWGTYIRCQNCHLSTTGDVDKRVSLKNKGFQNFSDTAPRIYSTQWADTGHGRSSATQYASGSNYGANKVCTDCHGSGETRAGGLQTKHGIPGNPFRWITAPDRPNVLCNRCHGVGGTASNKDILQHASSVTATGRHNFAMKCIDCHDPHGDNNRFMFHSTIARYVPTTGKKEVSNTYGQVLSTITTVNVDFTANTYTSDYARKFQAAKVCQVCHRRTYKPSDGKSRFRWYSAGDKTHGTGKCTTTCHKHTAGFKGAGVSSGGQDCIGCHDDKGVEDIVQRMRNPNNYHHVMLNTSATANPKYPNTTSFSGAAAGQKSSARKCLMCHVDHDIFNPGARGKGFKAKNLRLSVLAQGNNTGINTDFWPAKRKNATGRIGADSGTGNYSSTYPIYGPSNYNGVCISCHKNIQYKNTTLENDAIKTSRARAFPVSLYTSSSHNFQVISGIFRFSDDRSSFRGNCVKCHRTPDSDFSKLSKQAQIGRFPVALHDKNVPSLLMEVATSSSKPQIERLCFKCHDSASRASGGPGSMDFYSSIKMNSGAKMIKTAVVGKKYVKPIESDLMAGRHKIDEFYNVTGTVDETQSPPAAKFWNFSTTRHIECVDCHNTHGGNASIRRLVGAPFRGKLNTQQASYFNYTRDTGNRIAGAQKGVWGVSISYTLNDPTKRGKTPKFTKVAQVTYQYEVCLKCHSAFAYGSNPRGVPSGLPDPTGTTVVPYDNLATNVPQADISRMINPNNYGYHPIFRKGRNQPPKSGNTDQWPAAKSNWMYKDRFNNKTAFISVSGLSWTFVPPFSQHSLLACTDCHQADSTGTALGRLSWNGGAAPATVGSWTVSSGASLLKADDNEYAYTASSCINCSIEVTVAYGEAYPVNQPTSVNVVAYGRSTAGSGNARDETLAMYSSATLIGSAVTTRFSVSDARYEAAVATRSWAKLDSGTRKARVTIDTTNTGIMYIDYLGIEAIYPTTADVRGPHGSMERWLLTDMDQDVWFDADNNGSLSNNGTDRPNDRSKGTALDIPSANEQVFCWNCHRRDVYNDAPRYPYSRLDHADADVPLTIASHPNQWGIACMNCHAGGGVGEIHGSFANSTTPNGGADDGGVNWSQNPGQNLTRPRGVRLLNGANYAFNPSTPSCYEGTGSPTPFASGSCAGGINTGPVLNYTYTGW